MSFQRTYLKDLQKELSEVTLLNKKQLLATIRRIQLLLVNELSRHLT